MKNIRTDMLKESIAEYTDIAKSIKENSSEIIKEMLREAVADEYTKILAEDFAQDDDEEEVKDTESETEVVETEETEEESDDAVENETEESENEWTEEFEDLKTDDEEETYDLSNADDETVVKIFKRLNDSDEIGIKMDKESNKATIKALGDIPAGTEFVVEIDPKEENDGCTFEDASEEYNNDINESKMVEIVLNEDLGYTTKYQKTDAMTTPPMTEPGKNVNDWDAGVPKGKERPYGTKKAKTTPFTEEDEMPDMASDMEISEENVPVKPVEKWGVKDQAKGDKFHKIDKNWDQNPKTKTPSTFGLNEDGDVEEMDDIEEATTVGGAVQQRSKSKSHIPSGRKNYGPYTKHTVSTAESGYVGDVNESMRRKHNKIMQENKELKSKLAELFTMMTEAQVTNASIGLMNKLMTENSVAQDEKKAIYEQFNEVKTVNEAKDLYKRLDRELKKNSKMNLDEDKQFTVENSQKINENTLYASKDLMDSLNIMHKICR